MNQKNLDIWEQNKRAFFSDRLQSALKEWKDKGNGRTQSVFARMVEISDNMVTRYKKGEQYPSDKTLEKICKVLDKPKDYFVPTTKEELYKNSPLYMTKLGKSHADFAETIGLDLDFLKGLHDVVDFDSLFPMYSRIIRDDSDYFSPKYVRQSNFADSAPIDDELDFLQVHRDDQTLTLHRCDLAYLREVQDQVVEFVEYLFYKRREEMKREVEEVNRRTHSKTKDGGDGFRPLHREELLEIDRFAKYAYTDKPKEGGQDNGKH